MNELGPIISASMERAPWGWTLTGVVILALVKVWPIIQSQVIEARAKLRGERRDDLHNCQRRLDEIARRLDASESAHHRELGDLHDIVTNLKIEMSAVLSAYRLLEAETEARDPGSLGLRQARAILSTAFSVAPSTAPSPPGEAA